MTTRGGLSLLFDLFAADAAARALLAPVMAPTGLTAEQYALYSVLRTRGPITLTAFATAGHMPLTTASDHIRAMDRLSHVTRRRNPADGRSWLVELTPEGAAAHEVARLAFAEAARRVQRLLTLPEPEVRRALRAVEAACAGATDHLVSRETTTEP